jgi:hypothetical protein
MACQDPKVQIAHIQFISAGLNDFKVSTIIHCDHCAKRRQCRLGDGHKRE